MASPSYSVCSIRTLSSPISSWAPVLHLWLPSTPRFHTVCDQAQAAPPSQVLSQMRLPSPAPPLLTDCSFDPLGPSADSLTKQWPGAGHTQECLQDRAAANAQRLWPGASPPPKKFTRQCSSSTSGIMENHNRHLAPGFTLNDLVPAPANVAILWGLLGPGGLTASAKCPSSSGTASPMWLEKLPDPTLLLGIHPSHQSTARYRAVEFQTLCSPVYRVLM